MKKAYVDVEHGQLHYREEGAGAPLVLLHKTPSSSIQFERAMPALGERFRTIALDTPGFGNSDPLPRQPLMADYGQVVLQFLDALGLEQVDLLGHHTGASIAIEAATQQPKRFKHLALAGVLAFDEEAVRAEWRSYLDSHKFDLDASGRFLETYPKPMLERDQEFSPDDPERYWLELIAYLQAGPRFWWSYNAVVEHRAFDLLADVTMPTLVLNQEQGRVLESTRRVAAAIPHSLYVELPGSSEGVMDDPASFCEALISFLTSS